MPSRKHQSESDTGAVTGSHVRFSPQTLVSLARGDFRVLLSTWLWSEVSFGMMRSMPLSSVGSSFSFVFASFHKLKCKGPGLATQGSVRHKAALSARSLSRHEFGDLWYERVGPPPRSARGRGGDPEGAIPKEQKKKLGVPRNRWFWEKFPKIELPTLVRSSWQRWKCGDNLCKSKIQYKALRYDLTRAGQGTHAHVHSYF